MANFKKKAAIVGSAALALAVSTAAQAAFVLMPNGDFEAGSANWGIFQSGPGDATFAAAGGNPGGFGFVTNVTNGWGGGYVQGDPLPLLLSDYGLTGGSSTTFMWDQKDFNGDGAGVTGIKLESWTANAVINDTGDIDFNFLNTNWNTVTQGYTFNVAATHFKVVLVGTNAGQVGFDNLKIDSPIPVPAAAWLFGSGLLGLAGVARRKKAV